jgi:hypothetical protein
MRPGEEPESHKPKAKADKLQQIRNRNQRPNVESDHLPRSTALLPCSSRVRQETQYGLSYLSCQHSQS